MTQLTRVKSILEAADTALALFEIKDRIFQVFQRIDSEAAISARIRDLRQEMERVGSGTITGARAAGKAWQRYRINKRNQVAQPATLLA
ncbi:hypothetical protein [Pseudomonas sp.]|jgi:hypothetical protein|uniref:hypothetical protein n=1 Tax=Pseudomonas sp. TaxID=306 RepID=UPI002EDA5330